MIGSPSMLATEAEGLTRRTTRDEIDLEISKVHLLYRPRD
jgi:hypothetical protein